METYSYAYRNAGYIQDMTELLFYYLLPSPEFANIPLRSLVRVRLSKTFCSPSRFLTLSLSLSLPINMKFDSYCTTTSIFICNLELTVLYCTAYTTVL